MKILLDLSTFTFIKILYQSYPHTQNTSETLNY